MDDKDKKRLTRLAKELQALEIREGKPYRKYEVRYPVSRYGDCNYIQDHLNAMEEPTVDITLTVPKALALLETLENFNDSAPGIVHNYSRPVMDSIIAKHYERQAEAKRLRESNKTLKAQYERYKTLEALVFEGKEIE